MAPTTYGVISPRDSCMDQVELSPEPSTFSLGKLPQSPAAHTDHGVSAAQPALPTGAFEPGKWKAELKAILLLALPTMILTCSGQAMMVTDQIFLGHLGTDELAAAALGNTMSNLMWFFLMGTATAFDTLGSQAMGGGNRAAMVTWCFAAFIVTSLLALPVMAAQCFGRVVAINAFGQTEEIAELVGVFCRLLIPGMWPMMWGVILTKYLQVQNSVLVPALVSLVTFFCNIGLNALLIHYVGFEGAPLATTTSRWIFFLLMVITVIVYETWRRGEDQQRQQLEAAGGAAAQGGAAAGQQAGRQQQGKSKVQMLLSYRKNWNFSEMVSYTREQVALSTRLTIIRRYLALAIPGGLMFAFEVGSFDVTTVFAARLGTVAVAAHSSVLMTIAFTFVTFPFAVATAATIRVGSLLGAGNHATARLSGYIAVMLGAMFMAICAIFLVTLRRDLGEVYSNDPAIISTIAMIAPIAGLMQVSDGIMGTAQGVLRGCSYQGILMFYNFIGFWLFGCLFGFLLCFVGHLGLKGLWWGITSGNVTTGVMNVTTLLRVDWELQARNAQAKLQALAPEGGAAAGRGGKGDPQEGERVQLALRTPSSSRYSPVGNGNDDEDMENGGGSSPYSAHHHRGGGQFQQQQHREDARTRADQGGSGGGAAESGKGGQGRNAGSGGGHGYSLAGSDGSAAQGQGNVKEGGEGVRHTSFCEVSLQ